MYNLFMNIKLNKKHYKMYNLIIIIKCKVLKDIQFNAGNVFVIRAGYNSEKLLQEIIRINCSKKIAN